MGRAVVVNRGGEFVEVSTWSPPWAGGRMDAIRRVLDDLHTAVDLAATEVIAVSGSSSAGAADHLHAVQDTHRALARAGRRLPPRPPGPSPRCPTADGS